MATLKLAADAGEILSQATERLLLRSA
jgi:hypothetical protein